MAEIFEQSIVDYDGMRILRIEYRGLFKAYKDIFGFKYRTDRQASKDLMQFTAYTMQYFNILKLDNYFMKTSRGMRSVALDEYLEHAVSIDYIDDEVKYDMNLINTISNTLKGKFSITEYQIISIIMCDDMKHRKAADAYDGCYTACKVKDDSRKNKIKGIRDYMNEPDINDDRIIELYEITYGLIRKLEKIINKTIDINKTKNRLYKYKKSENILNSVI